MNHYTYQVEDRTTGEFYLGVRSCEGEPTQDPYMGSPKTWKPNKDNLWKRVLATYPTREKANVAERELIQTWIDHPWNRNAYIPNVGWCTAGIKLSDEHRAKVSAGLKGKRKGKTLSDEHRAKISVAGKGRIHSSETRAQMSAAHKGKNTWSKGKTVSDETKAQISAKLAGISKLIVECPHCQKSGGEPQMKRWHFDNCKNKP